MLAEYLLMVFDSMDDVTRRRSEIGALAHAGGSKLVDIFLAQIERESDRAVKPTLRNYLATRSASHQSTQNYLQRDTRSHPNYRLNLAISAMVQDSSTLHERIFYDTLYFAGCMDARSQIKLVGLDEEAIKEPHHSAADRAANEALGGFNKFIMSIREKSNGKTTDEG